MWSEVLRRRMMWRGCIDERLCWWCVRSWLDIRMVHRSMRNGFRVADKVYIKRGCFVLEDFLFFPLYSFSWIAKQARLCNSSKSCLVLILSIRISKAPCPNYDITLLLLISPTPDHACYTRMSPLQRTWYWMYCQHCLTPCFNLAWYYCEITDSYISICYLCSCDLMELYVPTPFEPL